MCHIVRQNLEHGSSKKLMKNKIKYCFASEIFVFTCAENSLLSLSRKHNLVFQNKSLLMFENKFLLTNSEVVL